MCFYKCCRKCVLWTASTDAIDALTDFNRPLNSHFAHFISRLEWLHTLIRVSASTKKSLSHATVLFFFQLWNVYSFFTVKVVERPLHMTSFSIPASLLGIRRCSNFSIVSLYTFCWHKGTRFTPDFCSLPGNNLSNCPLVMYSLIWRLE